jgi:uncharacterized ferredoxin-like protein
MANNRINRNYSKGKLFYLATTFYLQNSRTCIKSSTSDFIVEIFLQNQEQEKIANTRENYMFNFW